MLVTDTMTTYLSLIQTSLHVLHVFLKPVGVYISHNSLFFILRFSGAVTVACDEVSKKKIHQLKFKVTGNLSCCANGTLQFFVK